MKLLINVSMLGDKPTGLGIYSENCINGISPQIAAGLISNNNITSNIPTEIESPLNISIGSGIASALKRIKWLRAIKINSERLVYSPTHHGLPSHKNQIITIHDLICLKFPNQHILQYLFFRLILPRTIRNSRAIFTVSETTKKDIALTFGYPTENIFVVPNGVNTTKFTPTPKKSNTPFLLMVGARYPHKNVEEVIENAHLWAGNYKLVVASCYSKYRKKLLEKIKNKKLNGKVVFLDYVSHEKLIELYQECSALIYPSKWEGFGIPPLEAIACGTPVIASEIPVHKEVLADSAFFVKLGDPSSWQVAFNSLKNEDEVRLKLAAGKKRLDIYTWEKSATLLRSALLKVEPSLEII